MVQHRTPKSRRRLGILAAVSALAALGVGIAAWRGYEWLGAPAVLLGLTVESAKRFAGAWGPWSAAGSILLMILHSFLPLPAEIIAVANGMLFGVFAGVLVTWVGAMLGALLSFALARWLGPAIIRRWVSTKRWRQVEIWRSDPGGLLLVRLIPVISFNLINLAAGIAGVGWWRFVWTTGIGILPLTVVMVVAGESLLEAPAEWSLAATAVAVALWTIWRYISGRWQVEHMPDSLGQQTLRPASDD